MHLCLLAPPRACMVTCGTNHPIHEEEGNLTREILEEQVAMGWEGITTRVRRSMVGLLNVLNYDISRKVIKEVMAMNYMRELKLAMEGKSKPDMIRKGDSSRMLEKSFHVCKMKFK